MKSEIEKVKKDAKQQKGLLAIAKKQLTSREMERAKLEKELEEANVEVTIITREREEAESLAKLSTPLPDKRDLSSDSLTFAAGRALLSTETDAETIARRALDIAADICVYTNRNVTIETLQSG